MRALIVAAIAAAAWLAAGAMAYDDEIAEAAAYCEYVWAGVWPDYKGACE